MEPLNSNRCANRLARVVSPYITDDFAAGHLDADRILPLVCQSDRSDETPVTERQKATLPRFDLALVAAKNNLHGSIVSLIMRCAPVYGSNLSVTRTPHAKNDSPARFVLLY